MPAGSPSVKAKGCTALLLQHDPGGGNCFGRGRAGARGALLLLVLDHCLSSDLREVTLGLRTELLLGYFVTHFFFAGRIGLGFFFRAERKHLDALCSLIRLRQVADVRLVENIALCRWEIGGEFDHGIAHRNLT